MKPTEEDVLLFWWPLILRECKNSYKGLELEDRISEGALAFLYAIRTYKLQYGCFEDYAINQIRRIMKQQNAKAWAEKRLISSISLDAPLRNDNKSDDLTLSGCIGQEAIDGTLPEVKGFISSLSSEERRIINMRMKGYSFQSVSSTLTVSPYSINRMMNNIKIKHRIYYDEYFW